MACELCGKNGELFLATVEGVQMKVCARCGSFGKVLRREVPIAVRAKQTQTKHEPALLEHVVSDYGQRIRSAREKQGLTQEAFAKNIMLKESLLHKMETSSFEPPLELARRLERLLHITLVETREEAAAVIAKSEPRPEGMTIGDILKAKLKSQ